ncbi:hypothetical protein EON67_10930 [archaeon]|nr:MAG: hypothetical protein EON67_10930 [archaeon]
MLVQFRPICSAIDKLDKDPWSVLSATTCFSLRARARHVRCKHMNCVARACAVSRLPSAHDGAGMLCAKK